MNLLHRAITFATMTKTNRELLRDDEYCSIQLLPHRTLQLTWKGVVPGPIYREVLLEILDSITLNGIHYWLSDSRIMGPILHEDTVWTMSTFSDRLILTGLRRVAVVNSADIFHQMAAERMAAGAAPDVPYVIQFFDDVSDAGKWLQHERKLQLAG